MMWAVFLRTVIGLALHLAGQLRYAHVGFAPLHHRRHLDQQFLGRHTNLRRRLAQQSSRRSASRASRSGVVRSGHELVRNLRIAGPGPGVGHQAAEARPHSQEIAAAGHQRRLLIPPVAVGRSRRPAADLGRLTPPRGSSARTATQRRGSFISAPVSISSSQCILLPMH